jgi:uncharacterized protein YbaR (Trm112 family)
LMTGVMCQLMRVLTCPYDHHLLFDMNNIEHVLLVCM